MRRLLSALTAVAALLVAQGALSSSSPNVGPASCQRTNPVFWLEFGVWGGPGTPHAQRESFALAGSLGAGTDRPGGYAMYAWATPSKASRDPECTKTRLASRPDDGRLSRPYTYRRAGENVYFTSPNDRLIGSHLHWRMYDGVSQRDANGVTFRCYVAGTITVLVTDVAGGRYFTARIGRELYATALLRKDGRSTFRISKRCEPR